jgi:hypothetical protein
MLLNSYHPAFNEPSTNDDSIIPHKANKDKDFSNDGQITSSCAGEETIH